MQLFDLHCDTIYECLANNVELNDKRLHISIDKISHFSPYIQCFAICVPEEIRGKLATDMFKKAYSKLKEQCEKYDIILIRNYNDVKYVVDNKLKGAIFTVENASVLAGNIDNIKLFVDFGVKFVTLTWNGRNELGAGAMVTHSNGITPFGIEVIRELDNNNIFIDVSHTSDRLFNDIVMYSTNPIVATHSNSRAITNHKRNLTDSQFSAIVKKGGIVGINLYRDFLNIEPDKASKYDILRHVEHFLSLGGENCISLGGDFDGCNLTEDIKNIGAYEEIYQLFLKENYSEGLVEKIFFKNALNFCENFDK